MCFSWKPRRSAPVQRPDVTLAKRVVEQGPQAGLGMLEAISSRRLAACRITGRFPWTKPGFAIMDP